MTVIIGAGAAGLMAALAAVRQGKSVTVYEKMKRPGLKMSLAGGGRCNLSNTGDLLAGLHGENFLRPALAKLDFPGLSQVLHTIGLGIQEDEYGRAYPRNMNGKELVTFLLNHLERQGVRFYWNHALTGIHTEEGRLTALEIGWKITPCARAVLACGGNTWPRTGSDGAALSHLSQIGHTITPLLPALTPLKTREAWPTELKGLSINAEITALVKGKQIDQVRGDLLFTHFGVSGPAVLDISHCATKALHEGKGICLLVDFLPEKSREEIKDSLLEQRQKTAANALSTLLPSQLAKHLGSEQHIKSLAPSTLDQLAGKVKETRLDIVDRLGRNYAMVCQGGVSLREVNPRTMESRLIQGLYIAGEILSYHGRTGGYNLHAAFATGWLAGEHA